MSGDRISIGLSADLIHEFAAAPRQKGKVIFDTLGDTIPRETPRPPGTLMRGGYELTFTRSRLEARGDPIHIERDGLGVGYGIFGNPGSGKTYLLMHLLRQVVSLHAADPVRKFGGLLLDPKAALIDDIRETFAAAGRVGDLIVLNERDLLAKGNAVNVLDCFMSPDSLGSALSLAAQSAGVSGKEPFWLNEIGALTGATLALMRFLRPWTGTTETLKQLAWCLIGTEDQRDETGKAKSNLQALIDAVRLRMRELSEDRKHDLRIHITTLENHLNSDPKNRTTLLSFMNQAFGRFRLSGLDMYSSPTALDTGPAASLYDQAIADGKFILVSISRENIAVSRMLCTIIKVLFQQTVLSRLERHAAGELGGRGRQLLLMADEYSDVATDLPGNSLGDPSFVSLARQYGCMLVLATQNIQMLKTSGLGASDGAWEATMGNLAAKIFLTTQEPETAEYASKLVGKARVMSKVLSQSMGPDGTTLNVEANIDDKEGLQAAVLLSAFERGQGIVIGNLDGNISRPDARFMVVPPPEENP